MNPGDLVTISAQCRRRKSGYIARQPRESFRVGFVTEVNYVRGRRRPVITVIWNSGILLNMPREDLRHCKGANHAAR